VADASAIDVFAYPVRLMPGGWLIDGIKGRVDIDPTHWRESVDERPEYAGTQMRFISSARLTMEEPTQPITSGK
jgi:hypothetical protein